MSKVNKVYLADIPTPLTLEIANLPSRSSKSCAFFSKVIRIFLELMLIKYAIGWQYANR